MHHIYQESFSRINKYDTDRIRAVAKRDFDLDRVMLEDPIYQKHLENKLRADLDAVELEARFHH